MTTDDPGHDAREAVLAQLWLYTNWRYVTSQLTTEEREIWADAIDNHWRRVDPADPIDPVDRWWRDG